MKIVVIGIGQSLRGDDAAGLEAVRLWQEKYTKTAQRVYLEITELPGLGLMDLLEGMEAAVLVDALEASSPPGTVILIGPEDLASFTLDAQSAHGWGVAEALQLGRALNPALAKVHVTLIGIIGKEFGMHRGISLEVRQALPNIVDKIEAEVQGRLLEKIA